MQMTAKHLLVAQRKFRDGTRLERLLRRFQRVGGLQSEFLEGKRYQLRLDSFPRRPGGDHGDQPEVGLVEPEELLLLKHEVQLAIESVPPAVVFANELPAEASRRLARRVWSVRRG